MRIFVDSTFGETIIDALKSLFRFQKGNKPRLIHIYDNNPRDVKDPVWTDNLYGDDLIVISGDLGYGKGERLPVLCKEKNITCITISGTLQNAPQFHKARAILALWPDIIDTFEAPQGSRFQIQAIGADYRHFRLIPK